MFSIFDIKKKNWLNLLNLILDSFILEIISVTTPLKSQIESEPHITANNDDCPIIYKHIIPKNVVIIRKINFINEDLSKLILTGCISLILLQTFIHVGVNIRILPTTGMTLPFLSYGGSSIISTAIVSGLILNLTKRKLD